MKLKRIFLTGAAAAALAAAAAVPVIVTSWFSQTFDSLADGSSFTGTQGGASGGTWGAIDAGVATVATVSGRKCIEVDTLKSASAADIRFTASQDAPKSIERFEFSICAEPMPWYPAAADDEKGALVLMSNDGGLLAFGGYTRSGWMTLYGHGMAQRSQEWIDCLAEFDYSGVTPYVTYYAKIDGSDYQPLADSEGTTRFLAMGGSSSKAKAVSFGGKGFVGAFRGQGVERDTTRENEWKGADGGDWDVATNWSRGKVPADGDVAVVKYSGAIRRTVDGTTYEIVVYRETRLVLVSGESFTIESGDVELKGDFTSWGVIVVGPGVKLRAQGTFYGIEMGYASTLQIAPEPNVLTVTAKPLHLEGVKVNLTSEPFTQQEAFALLSGPYGSGGLAELTVNNIPAYGWSLAWHGRLDGTSALWIVNDNYGGLAAVWKKGAWGNLTAEANWESWTPGEDLAAQMPYGQAHVNQWDAFAFARRFEIGTQDDESGEVDMSGGSVKGNKTGAAVLVGAQRGEGLLDIVGGSVRPCDYLWNSALTVGAESHASGTVMVRGGVLDAAGGVSVGAAGGARMEICEGRASAAGPFAVGYGGKLDVTGGSLTVSNAVYVGRTTRGETYDVAMTVSGGAVSNVAEGAFWVGSYGGAGSRAAMTVSGGTVSADRLFVCGGYRSARVDVTGGTLVAPEICLGSNFVDVADSASFNLVAGRVETAGFTAGANGARTVTLANGELVATAANGDFFKGLDAVRLDGETVFENAEDVATTAGLVGPGGFVKTGKGTLALGGYAAWAGKTTVAEGTLDMGGGMIMGGLEVAEGASVTNVKYDDIDSLSFNGDIWKTGTVSTRPYLGIDSTMTANESSIMRATDGDGVLKGAISFAATDGGMTFRGWTAFGWTDLRFADGAQVTAGASYDLHMGFDFNGRQYYVFYYAKRNETYERLVSTDGLAAFPVAGALASVKTFDGTGIQLTVDSQLVARWIGGAAGKWNVAANWSSSAVPRSSTRAFVDTPATIDVTGADNSAAMLVANARVTLTGGSLKVGGKVSGAGTLVLSNATVSTPFVALPVESAAGTENTVGAAGATLASAIKGAGTLSVVGKVCGDTQAFAGALLLDGSIGAEAASDNALSSWRIAGTAYPFAATGKDYAFGALNGTISAKAGDADDINLSVGMRDEDCSLNGGWPKASQSAIVWTAPSATLAYGVVNAACLGLSGGGKVALAKAEALPTCVSFIDNGGTLSFAEGVACDPSAALKDSTAAMAFDDGGADYTWASAISASNVGGFVKRGAGTLTLAAAPQYKGATVVEDGVLVVPFGTRMDGLTVSRTGKVVLDMGGTERTGVALAIARANRELLMFDGKYFSITNGPAQYSLEVNDNNGLVISVGSDNFVWTGNANAKWSDKGNWSVNGKAATRPPAEQDDVRFYANAAVEFDADVQVRNIVCDDGLSISGSSTLTASSLRMTSGMLTFGGDDDGAMTLDVLSDIAVSTLAGTGSVHVANGTLVLSPGIGIDSKFVGTLGVTNFVKAGVGMFEYEPRTAQKGTLEVVGGTLRWNCSYRGMVAQTAVSVRVSADTELDLCGLTVTVGSFAGAGTVGNDLLITSDGVFTQHGGMLTVNAVDQATYVASQAGEKLRILDAADKDVRIVIPRDWFVAGVSGKQAVFCESKNIIWDIRSKAATKPVDEGNGWWSIAGSGFTVRLK